MSSLTSSFEGWDFFDDGSMVGPAGQSYDVYGNSTSSGIGDLLSGVTGLLGYAGKVGIDTWQKKTLTQQGIDGQRYIEGQRLAADQMRLQQQYGGGGMMPLLLIAGFAVIAVVLSKS